MNLQQQFKSELFQFFIIMKFNHRCNYNVGCTSLYWSVYCSSQTMTHRIWKFTITGSLINYRLQMPSQIPIPPKKSLGPTLFQSNCFYLFLPSFNFRTISVPRIHCRLGLLLSTAPVFHKSVHRFSVSDAEIHNFGLFAMVGVKIFEQRNWRLSLTKVPFEQTFTLF